VTAKPKLARAPGNRSNKLSFLQTIALLGLFLGLSACAPSVTVVNHSPEIAAEEAQQFAKAALIDHDLGKAYEMLGAHGTTAPSFDQFADAIRSSHPKAFPVSVTPIEYEPVPGKREMNIFLYGENGEEKFYYRFVMEGVTETGYQVFGIWRHDGPYPPSPLRRRIGEGF
jgi:hypothetical protein